MLARKLFYKVLNPNEDGSLPSPNLQKTTSLSVEADFRGNLKFLDVNAGPDIAERYGDDDLERGYTVPHDAVPEALIALIEGLMNGEKFSGWYDISNYLVDKKLMSHDWSF